VRASAHFAWDEVTASDTADALGLDNTPTAAHRRTIETVTAPGMEAVRAACGARPVIVTSWYRHPAVNRHPKVGGVAGSAHELGFAVDFRVAGQTPLASARLILAAGLRFDQLIWEKSRGVLHISFDPRRRGQVLTQPKGPGTPVLVGLVERS
jgi:hypothetical protein